MSYGVSSTDQEGLPFGIKPLAHQVSGHCFKSKEKLGCLESEDGEVLKPCQDGNRGKTELLFYKNIYEELLDSVRLALRTFLPEYNGLWSSPLFPNATFLKLEDVTKKYKKPCIIDVKIGPKTWDPEASKDKIEREKNKFPPVTEVGFTMGGFRVYDKKQDAYSFVGKMYLRSLNEEEVISKGLSIFFNTKSPHFHRCTIQSLLDQLYPLKQWFETQTEMHFYASSLLVVYEGDREIEPSKCALCMNIPKRKSSSAHLHSATNGEKHNSPKKPNHPDRTVSSCHADSSFQNLIDLPAFDRSHADVRMIDFTHVFPANNTTDENYLFGLNGLIKRLQMLLE